MLLNGCFIIVSLSDLMMIFINVEKRGNKLAVELKNIIEKETYFH